MTADLRRLAEQATPHTVSRLNYKDGRAILALLDEREQIGIAWADAAEAQMAAERRVAVLEELLGEIVIEYPYLDPKHPWAGFVERARALLERSEEATPASGSMPWDDLSLPMHQAPAPRTAEEIHAEYQSHPKVLGAPGCICDIRARREAEPDAPAGSLDVERLAEALGRADGVQGFGGKKVQQEWAERIAVEYARLLRERETAEEPSDER